MVAFSDLEFDKLSLLEGAMLVSAAVDPKTSVHWVKGRLAILLREAQEHLAEETDAKKRLEGLLDLFYKKWNFKGDFEQYFSAENTFIEKVLRRRKGIPISLGAVLLYFADHLDIPLKPVGFPTQLILKVDLPDSKPQYLNPFDGEFLSDRMLRGWLIGKDGPNVQIEPEHLEVSAHSTLITRWLGVMKNALLREEEFLMALRCSEIALAMKPDDPYEIRDRGFIFQQLDCDWVAAEDYEYFIEHCPNDPAADLLKLQVKVLTEEEPVFH